MLRICKEPCVNAREMGLINGSVSAMTCANRDARLGE